MAARVLCLGRRVRTAALLRAGMGCEGASVRVRGAVAALAAGSSSADEVARVFIRRHYVTASTRGAAGRCTLPCRTSVRAFSSYPAHQVVGLPALSPTMERGTIAAWSKKEGESFGPGDVLCEVETDKATVSFDAQDEGVVAKILVEAGTEIKVGEPILVVVEDASTVSAFASFKVELAAASSPAAAAPAPAAAPSAPSSPAPPAPATPPPAPVSPLTSPHHHVGRVFASPLAKTLAAQKGYDLRSIPGTGPNGRIVAADVREFVPSLQVHAPAASASAAGPRAPTSAPLPLPSVPGAGYTDYPLSDTAKAIAARLTHSKQVVPHYYLTVDLSLAKLLAVRDTLNADVKDEKEADKKISVNDFFIKAAALACRQVPDANASWHGEFVRHYETVNVNLAVGVGDGLVAPVIRGVEGKGIKAISSEVREVVQTIRDGSVAPESLQTGTFSIVNVGAYGVKSVAPIVTVPQACVLGVGAIENRVLPKGSGDAWEVVPGVTVTLSCDHRVIDGAVGAQWLSVFKNLIEDPITLLL